RSNLRDSKSFENHLTQYTFVGIRVKPEQIFVTAIVQIFDLTLPSEIAGVDGFQFVAYKDRKYDSIGITAMITNSYTVRRYLLFCYSPVEQIILGLFVKIVIDTVQYLIVSRQLNRFWRLSRFLEVYSRYGLCDSKLFQYGKYGQPAFPITMDALAPQLYRVDTKFELSVL